MKLQRLAASIPENLPEDPEFAQLSTEKRAQVQRVLDAIRDCAAAHTCVGNAVQAFAGRMGWHVKKARRVWDNIRHKGWRGALDGRAQVHGGALAKRLLFVAKWQALCDQHNGSLSAAWHDLVTLYRSGARIDGYEEYHGRPPVDPRTGLPEGWSYRQLCRLAPDKQERTLTRVGRKAFVARTTALWFTRAELHCGEVYQFDDVWHDHKVFFGKQLVRPLELGCIDLFSTRRVKYGLAPQVKDENDAKQNLKESYMRWLVVSLLSDTGYWPEGCALVVENRTAALDDTFAEAIFKATAGKVRVERSGLQNKPALLGWWAGEGGGQPRMKATLESLHGYYHNRLGILPAQTGGNSRLDKPEALAALDKYVGQLIRELDKFAPAQVEALLGLLRLPALTFGQFHGLLERYYQVIDARDRHEIEGWDKAGLVRSQWRFARNSEDWRDAGELATMPETQYAMVRSVLDADPLLMRPHRMSPMEVWTEGQRKLRRIQPWTIHQLLKLEDAREVTVRSHRIEFADQEIDPDGLRFEGAAVDPQGRKVLLSEGETYLAYVNPLSPRMAIVVDGGQYVGVSLRIERATRTSREEVFRAIGADAQRQQERMLGYQSRNAGEAVEHQDMLDHNRLVLAAAAAGRGGASDDAIVGYGDGADVMGDLARRARIARQSEE